MEQIYKKSGILALKLSPTHLEVYSKVNQRTSGCNTCPKYGIQDNHASQSSPGANFLGKSRCVEKACAGSSKKCSFLLQSKPFRNSKRKL